MKKKIIEIVFALLIAIFIAFRYINAIWPHTIPCIDGLTTFVGVTLFGFLWLTLYPDKEKPRYFALIVVACICLVIIPTTEIEKKFEKKDKTIRLGYVLYKYKSGNTKGGRVTPDMISVIINDSLKTSFYVNNETIKNINVGDTITSRVSGRNHIDCKNLFPTHEEIERYKVPQHYINGKLQVKPPYEQYAAAVRDSMLRMSHNQIGYVFEKTDDEYFRHLVKVGIDAEHTTTHEFYETDRNYPKVYKRLNVGDTVILQVSDSMPEINRVLCWQPNEKEIAEYASVLQKEYNLDLRLLRRLIRVETNRTKKAPLYDLDYDVQLNEAISIINKENFASLVSSTKTLKELQEEAGAEEEKKESSKTE